MSWTAVFSLHALWIPHQLAGAAGWRRVEGASVLLLSTVRSMIVYYWNFEPSIVSSINCIKCNYQISLTLDHSNAYLYIVSQWLAVHAFLQVLFSLHSAEVLLQMSMDFTMQTQSIICSTISNAPATGSLSVPTWLTHGDISVACAPTPGHVISDWKNKYQHYHTSWH